MWGLGLECSSNGPGNETAISGKVIKTLQVVASGARKLTLVNGARDRGDKPGEMGSSLNRFELVTSRLR